MEVVGLDFYGTRQRETCVDFIGTDTDVMVVVWGGNARLLHRSCWNGAHDHELLGDISVVKLGLHRHLNLAGLRVGQKLLWLCYRGQLMPARAGQGWRRS